MNDNYDFPGEHTLYDQGNFEKLLSGVVARLKLDEQMDRNELSLLGRAFFCACLCNIAFNGLGGCDGKIKPERERNRIALEQDFMSARDRLYASQGWQYLPSLVRQRLDKALLRVEITEENLAR